MLKSLIKRNIIDRISRVAIREIVKSDQALNDLWFYSCQIFPNLKDHFTLPVASAEIEDRIRLLIIAEALFVRTEIDKILEKNDVCSYADVGDSDGSIQLLAKKFNYGDKLHTVGVNLQQSAVDKIKSKGLNAFCADALQLGRMGKRYDIVSLFETLEHISDPVGFLTEIKSAVNHCLIISVPFIRSSRVGLAYVTDKWPTDKVPTIENTHIFELVPKDWQKLFRHTGWAIRRQSKLLMYHPQRLSRIVLEPYWRYVSFEGFWFVALTRDNKYADRYCVE